MNKFMIRSIVLLIGAIFSSFVMAVFGFILGKAHFPGIEISTYLQAVLFLFFVMVFVSFIGLIGVYFFNETSTFFVFLASLYILAPFIAEYFTNGVELHWILSLVLSLSIFMSYLKFWMNTFLEIKFEWSRELVDTMMK